MTVRWSMTTLHDQFRHSCVLRLHSDDRYRQFDSKRHLTGGSMEETPHWQLVFEDSASATNAKGSEIEDIILSTGVCGLVTKDTTSTVIVVNFWSLEPPLWLSIPAVRSPNLQHQRLQFWAIDFGDLLENFNCYTTSENILLKMFYL